MSLSVSTMIKGAGALAAGLAAGYQFFSLPSNARALLRPPGALDEPDFVAACIRCGKCSLVCPYRVVVIDDKNSKGTPYLIPREGACRLCEDFPCIAACPTGALAPVSQRSEVRMGIAVIDRDRCIALQGIRCEVCYRVCPLIDDAIKIKYAPREGDPRHMIFEPVIDSERCVGCGICEERCVVSNPMAIYIKPRSS